MATSNMSNSRKRHGISFFYVFMLLAFAATGQDIIELRDGKRIETKVIEVLKKEVVYKKFSNLNGPSYRVETKDIATITYESGAVDNYNKKDSQQNDAEVNSFLFGRIPRVEESELGNNIIAMDVVDLMVQNITFSYERLFGDRRRVGIRVPFSASLLGTSANSNTVLSQHNLYYSGLDLSFYPFGQGQSRFLLGPSIRLGSARKRDSDVFIGYDTTYVNGNPQIEAIYQNNVTLHPYFSFMVHGGFNWNPVKELSIHTLLGIGTRKYLQSAPNNDDVITTAFFTVSIGYRF
jgi:hypothetical protein